MRGIHVVLENCYGIPSLDAQFDFGRCNAAVVYAPNGTMKSSLAKTLEDVALDRPSGDLYFAGRSTTRRVEDAGGQDLRSSQVYVVHSFDQDFAPGRAVSNVLVDPSLRGQYDELRTEVATRLSQVIDSLKKRMKTRRGIDDEVVAILASGSVGVAEALLQVRAEVLEDGADDWCDIPYAVVFDSRVMALLSEPGVADILDEFVARYTHLLEQSKFLGKGNFTLFDADSVEKSLRGHKYFDRGHGLVLHGDSDVVVERADDLLDLIKVEREAIAADPVLQAKFSELEVKVNSHEQLRKFFGYVQENPGVLANLVSGGNFQHTVLVSYLAVERDAFEDFCELYDQSRTQIAEIERKASVTPARWQRLISVFNERFAVPFELVLENSAGLVLGTAEVPVLGFAFRDETELVPVERGELFVRLSQGERRALYLLQVLFELEEVGSRDTPTLIVVDDIADSFDYRNKYAIVEYLKELADNPSVRLLVLTHNFDFFRTLESRGVVAYNNCYIAERRSAGGLRVDVRGAEDFKNPFARKWKDQLQTDPCMRLASIPFARNLIEYTRGPNHPDYSLLTDMLHVREDSHPTQADLDAVFARLFGERDSWRQADDTVREAIQKAGALLESQDGDLALHEKVVLAMACRLLGENLICLAMGDAAGLASIKSHQTSELVGRYRNWKSCDPNTLKLLERVLLLTPESIHLNAFMYEPLVDMSGEHLVELHSRLRASRVT